MTHPIAIDGMSKRGGSFPASLEADGGGGGERIAAAAAALAGEEEGITGGLSDETRWHILITQNKPGAWIGRM